MDPRFKFWLYITCLYVLNCVTDSKTLLMIYFSWLQIHDPMMYSVCYILISDEGSLYNMFCILWMNYTAIPTIGSVLFLTPHCHYILNYLI